jgi:hypothetical protein
VSAAAGSSPAVVQLSNGSRISASKGVVVAVEGPEAARLLGQAMQVRATNMARDLLCLLTSLPHKGDQFVTG